MYFAMSGIADVYLQQKKGDKAIERLKQQIAKDPQASMLYGYLGRVNAQLGHYDDAEAAFKKAHDLNPNLTRIHLWLANIYVMQHKWQEVIDETGTYLKENPNAPDRAAVEDIRAKIAKEHAQ